MDQKGTNKSLTNLPPLPSLPASQNTAASFLPPVPIVTAVEAEVNGITISINGIGFDTDSEDAMELLKTVKQLFVSFELLDTPSEELETHSVSIISEKGGPQDVVFSYAKCEYKSIDKTSTNMSLTQQFYTVFDLNPRTKARDRSNLARLVKSRNPYITFSVVSEPPENDADLECQDLAAARLDLRDFLHEDLANVALPLYNMEGDIQLGDLFVSLTGQSVIDAL